MPVYKDECVYTFDNQESPYGIDVCLTCFIATSPDPQHDFTAYHARISGHTAFLNLRKVPLPEHAKAEPQLDHQPKKLAIQDKGDDEKFELITTFKTLANDKEEDYQEAIQKVLTSESHTARQHTEAWELELQVCPHVAMLESELDGKPPQPLSAEQLSKCSQCDLRENLWICLHCGNIACGRRHFDGSGGNGHALEHYEKFNHPLAVKLGSITPDGHADVYCYADDEEVKDPKIREHLAHWGIDIAKHVKTEKSMTELQIEQNMNWDFSSGVDGEVVSGRGFTGMKNLGNSCYVNSVLQSLFGIPEFADAFARNDPEATQQIEPESLKTQLNKLKDGLLSGRYDVVSPQMLKYLVGQGHSEFTTARQQDAFEYLSYFLTKVSQLVDKRLVAELFGFETERRIACKHCGAVRYIPEKEESLSIPVPIDEQEDGSFRSVEISEMLDIFTREESIESKCPVCGKSEAASAIKFKTFPKVLIINARRFRIVNWVPQKVDVPVIVPDKPLSLDQYLSLGPQPDENVVSNDDNAEEFTPDPAKLEMLESMGFEKSLCSAALKIAHDRGYGEGDFEAAIEIIVNGEAQQVADSDTAANAGATSASGKKSVDPESLVMLESMGFSVEQSTVALEQNNSNVEAAVEWLFAGNFDTYVPPAPEPEGEAGTEEAPKQLGDASLPASYKLSSIVCHKGASVHVGHYVSAIRKNDEMFLYNDEKVSKGTDTDELQKFAYIYMFRRI